jgi:hypothetical protein
VKVRVTDAHGAKVTQEIPKGGSVVRDTWGAAIAVDRTGKRADNGEKFSK